MSMVHDNIILSYRVDFESDTLTLKTQSYLCEQTSEEIDVIFTDYLTHIFCDEIKGSIIFDVEERSVDFFIKQERKLIENKRNYCWPIHYKADDVHAELTEFMHKSQYKAFEISSSYGLNGWVLAKQMEFMLSK